MRAITFLVTIWLVNGNKTPEVATLYGRIRGFEDVSSRGRPFYQFNAIPYAKPPIGNLRFKRAEPVQKWNGIHDGTKTVPMCPGFEILTHMKNRTTRLTGEEDCLVLSVSVPKESFEKKTKLPVMVYIHGGAYLASSGKLFEGHELMNEDVILVTLNYRLGVLGFLSTEDKVIPGNFGLTDQTLALRWIKENIKSFGGIPDQITIFGLSAGGASVHFHLLSPYSRGLFNKASLQSGTLLCHWASSRGHRNSAVQLAAQLGCFVNDKIDLGLSKALLQCLQKVDYNALVHASADFMKWTFLPLNFGPYIDGDIIPNFPEILLKNGDFADVNLIIGVTKDDGAFVSNSIYSHDEYQKELEENFDNIGPLSLGLSYDENGLEVASKVYQKYLGERKATVQNAEKLTQLLTDSTFAFPSEYTALFHANRSKVFYYQLDHRGQRSLNDIYDVSFGKHWINHADEAYYQFPMNQFGKIERSEEDVKIRDMILKMWTNFAKTGDPTPDQSLGFQWLPISGGNLVQLSIQNPPRMTEDLRKERRDFWSSLPINQNHLLFGKSPQSTAKTEL